MKLPILTITVIVALFFLVPCAFAQTASAIKLPYANGQSFVVVQGYNSLPTHIKNDAYALDFSQNGCDAYGKLVVAALGGTAMTVQQEGYNGGYGTEVVINHGNNLISRYAHMIPGSVPIMVNQIIRQGQTIGAVGDTGLVAGMACPGHPGTHLHFAMDVRASNGTLTAYDPEPISGYRNVTAGKWYVSDNAIGAVAIVPIATSVAVSTNTSPVTSTGKVLGAYDDAVVTTTVIAPSAPTQNIPIAPLATGGVSVSTVASAPSLDPVSDVTSSSAFVIAPVPTSTVIFQQPDDSVDSAYSWYDDNWYDLGNNFNGTLNALTLEGKISDSSFFASHISLQEFKDANYTALVQGFVISDNVPFNEHMATATFTGLSIPLKPYFYYRLTTIQDYQNRSVILAGTHATGTMMSDAFVYGVGRVESTSTFMPFMEMDGIVATSTPLPPALTIPTNLTTTFDPTTMELGLLFATSTDPDWSDNPLHYELNYSTSTAFANNMWGVGFPISVATGNSYLLGVRAADNFGDVSAVATTTWSFPAGFVAYHLSPPLGHAEQPFTVSAPTTLSSVDIFVTNFQTSARNFSAVDCLLSLAYTDPSSSVQEIISADNAYDGYHCNGDLNFSFASSSPALFPGQPYRWIFDSPTGNPSTGAWVQFYGRDDDVAGGMFSDPSLANARFSLNASSGVIFAN